MTAKGGKTSDAHKAKIAEGVRIRHQINRAAATREQQQTEETPK